MASAGRHPEADLEAIAAMPGLEAVAEAIAVADTAKRASSRNYLAITILIAARWAFGGSMNQLTTALRTSSLWDRCRESAARVGRQLPADPPTEGQFRHLRDRTPGLGRVAATALTPIAVELTQQLGLLEPADPTGLPLSSSVTSDKR